jgi:hypothetical protein
MPMLGPGESFDAGLVLRIHRGREELRDLEKTIGAAR